jgi:hypothetical protein
MKRYTGETPVPEDALAEKRRRQAESEYQDICVQVQRSKIKAQAAHSPPASFVNNGQNTSSNIGNTGGNKNSASMPSSIGGWIWQLF